MKKSLLILSTLLGIHVAHATTLIDVYQQALTSDQIYQQALSQRLSDQQGMPISLSALLPTMGVVIAPSVTKTLYGGSAATAAPVTNRAIDMKLTLTQTVFDMGKYANFAGSRALYKQADATLNAATQDLMLRVAKAYFAVLYDEDSLRNFFANRKAYAKQLDQVKQQYNVGLKTITDVYTAQASYDAAAADYIAAENTLANDKENLRVITGVLYPSLGELSESFPLVSPQPANMEAWVRTAQKQNWSIKAAQYASDAARQAVKQQFAGHIPTLDAQAGYDLNHARIISTPRDAIEVATTPGGSLHTHTRSVSLVLNVPLVQGGFVVASTRKAQYDYQVVSSRLDQQVRTVTNTTRQSYLGVLAGISKIKADRQAVKSAHSSLEGLQAAYDVGTSTLVDVLNQQQKLLEAQQQYAADRYAFVNNWLALKAAAGTLSDQDLAGISMWLRGGGSGRVGRVMKDSNGIS